jgi:hypothetical protein
MLSICRTLAALTGGNTTVTVIRAKFGLNIFQQQNNYTFYTPDVPLDENCCVTLTGSIISRIVKTGIPAPPPDQDGTIINCTTRTEIKCDGQVVHVYQQVTPVTVDGGSTVAAFSVITPINAAIDIADTGKDPDPGALSACITLLDEDQGPTTLDINITGLVICTQSV